MSIFDTTHKPTDISLLLLDSDSTPISIASGVVWTNIILCIIASIIIYVELIRGGGEPLMWAFIFGLALQCLMSWALFKMFAAITTNVIYMRMRVCEHIDRSK